MFKTLHKKHQESNCQQNSCQNGNSVLSSVPGRAGRVRFAKKVSKNRRDGHSGTGGVEASC